MLAWPTLISMRNVDDDETNLLDTSNYHLDRLPELFLHSTTNVVTIFAGISETQKC